MAISERSIDLPIFIADAFTRRPFSGNSAGVCLIPYDQDVPSSVLQNIAAELNISETAFVKTIKEGDTFQNSRQFNLRWFTPVCEVSLCGHATLASSAVLFSQHVGNKSDVLEFSTQSGVLKAKKLSNNRIEMDLPAYESVSVTGKYENLVKAVVGKLPVADVVRSQNTMLLIRLQDQVTRDELEKIQPNESELLAHTATDVHGVIVTLRGSGNQDCADEEGCNYDFVSRYFAPWVGIFEDPVTGSAHCALAPFWSKVLNKKKFYARQCSRRGGELHLELIEDRLIIRGHVVVVLRGRMNC